MSHKQQHPRSDFEQDPLSSRLHSTAERTAGHHKLPSEHTKDEAGVCEAYPGIIESTDIDPLHHERMKEEKSSTASKATGGPRSIPGPIASAANTALGAAKYAYSAAIGDQAGKQAGKEMMGSK